MTLDPRQLAHRVHASPAVYLVLRNNLERKQFEEMLARLEGQAGHCDTGASREAHWNALGERMTGRSPWDSIVERFEGPVKGVEGANRFRGSEHAVSNIIVHRPYTAYTVEKIQYVVDLFNPGNELEVPYARAGESVVVLLLREVTFGAVQYRLDENKAFYSIIRDIADILQPEYLQGTYSMFPVLLAYQEGRASATERPWDLLFPLSLLTKPAEIAHRAGVGEGRTTNDSLALLWPVLGSPKLRELPIARLFKKVVVWNEDKVLVQVAGGLDSVMRDEYMEAARTLGMTAAQELALE